MILGDVYLPADFIDIRQRWQRSAFKFSNIASEIKPIFLAFHRTSGADTILAKESAQ